MTVQGAAVPAPDEVPVRPVRWNPCWRIVPSRFPPIDLFERIADPADWEALAALESLTNDRVREQIGALHLVPVADRVSGPGASVLMAPFTHPNPSGSRFAELGRGVFYAARALDTAVAETVHHRAAFLHATRQPRIEIDMRVYAVDLDGRLHDIRGGAWSTLTDPDSYAASQAFARRLHAAGADGIAYDSVRHRGGECAAVFRPRLLSNVRQERHLCYVWDGTRIAQIYEKRGFG